MEKHIKKVSETQEAVGREEVVHLLPLGAFRSAQAGCGYGLSLARIVRDGLEEVENLKGYGSPRTLGDRRIAILKDC
jgi:hypothetical protein